MFFIAFVGSLPFLLEGTGAIFPMPETNRQYEAIMTLDSKKLARNTDNPIKKQLYLKAFLDMPCLKPN